MEGLREPRDMRGIIPCSFDQIFETISANPQPEKKFLVRVYHVYHALLFNQLHLYNDCIGIISGNL
jgi:hypothetical protein